MESAILHIIRRLSFSVIYKCRRIPSYDLKYTLTSLSSKVDREYILCYDVSLWAAENNLKIIFSTMFFHSDDHVISKNRGRLENDDPKAYNVDPILISCKTGSNTKYYNVTREKTLTW